MEIICVQLLMNGWRNSVICACVHICIHIYYGSWGHYPKWNKSHKERQILYDLFFYGVFQTNKWSSNKTQAHRYKEQIGDYQRQSYMNLEKMCGVWVCVCVCVCLHAQLYTTLCNPMAPLCMEFSRQEYWSGLPFPSPGYLSNPGIKSVSLKSPALSGRFFTTAPPAVSGTYKRKWKTCPS